MQEISLLGCLQNHANSVFLNIFHVYYALYLSIIYLKLLVLNCSGIIYYLKILCAVWYWMHKGFQ